MTTRDKIENLGMAIADAEEALRDDAYAVALPNEYAHINGFIADCKRQRLELERQAANVEAFRENALHDCMLRNRGLSV